MLIQNFGGTKKSILVNSKMAYGSSRSRLIPDKITIPSTTQQVGELGKFIYIEHWETPEALMLFLGF